LLKDDGPDKAVQNGCPCACREVGYALFDADSLLMISRRGSRSANTCHSLIRSPEMAARHVAGPPSIGSRQVEPLVACLRAANS